MAGCSGLGGGGSGMWVFFFLGNFGGDRRVWLSFGGWCCVGLLERDKKIEEMEMKEKKEKPKF